MSILNSIVSSKISDKRDDFNFEIVNFHFLDVDGPRSPSYGVYTVSQISYAPLFQGPHFLTKMLESNILYDNLFIDTLSV